MKKPENCNNPKKLSDFKESLKWYYHVGKNKKEELQTDDNDAKKLYINNGEFKTILEGKSKNKKGGLLKFNLNLEFYLKNPVKFKCLDEYFTNKSIFGYDENGKCKVQLDKGDLTTFLNNFELDYIPLEMFYGNLKGDKDYDAKDVRKFLNTNLDYISAFKSNHAEDSLKNINLYQAFDLKSYGEKFFIKLDENETNDESLFDKLVKAWTVYYGDFLQMRAKMKNSMSSNLWIS